MKSLNQSIEKLENEISEVRNKFNNKSIWLFILIVSIDNLNSSVYLKLFAYIIAIIIYFYYLQLAIGKKGNFLNRYQVLINSLEVDTIQNECVVCLIEKSQAKMKKIAFYDILIFILSILFYVFSIYQFFSILLKV